MSEKTPFWKQPQNYIIAILLLGIAGYIGYQQLQPKTNKLAQASAYFDAIDAEERSEAEKKRAAEEKEKARLAAIEMEKAKEEVRIAQQKARIAEEEKQAIKKQAKERQQATNNSSAKLWTLENIGYCTPLNSGTTFCDVTCVNGLGQKLNVSGLLLNYTEHWGWYNQQQVSGYHKTRLSFFQAYCASKR